MERPKNAYVLRQSPSGNNVLDTISLPQDVIVNGWSDAKGLLEEQDYWRFREIVKDAVYPNEDGYRKAGYGAATMWRFIREMKSGDWVVVPHVGGVFYVSQILGPAFCDLTKEAISTDSCYRRPVRWLNNKQPIPRKQARSRLISRMRTQQTSAYASDLIDEIANALELASAEKPINADLLFANNLRANLIEPVRHEIAEGHMDERNFELLVQRLLLAMGATSARLVPRLKDKGVDILAEFPLGPVGKVRLGVQVKYHRGQTGKEWVEQLWNGLKEEDVTLGWLVTSADFAPDVQRYLEEKVAASGLEISLVDGRQLAEIIVDYGLERLLREQRSE